MKHTTTNRVTLNYWKDGDWFVGQLLEVPAVISQGETLEELQENILDAYQLVIAELQSSPHHPRSRSKVIEVPVLA